MRVWQASLEEEQHKADTIAEARRQVVQHQASANDHSLTPGLRNLAGEYNCFLNVVLQCLWHCRPFRDALMQHQWQVMRPDSPASC